MYSIQSYFNYNGSSMPLLAKFMSSNFAVIAITVFLTYSAVGIISTLSGMMLTIPFAVDAAFGIRHMLKTKIVSPYLSF